LMSKRAALLAHVERYSPDAVLVQETRFDSSTEIFIIPGYSSFHTPFEKSPKTHLHGANGVGLFVKKRHGAIEFSFPTSHLLTVVVPGVGGGSDLLLGGCTCRAPRRASPPQGLRSELLTLSPVQSTRLHGFGNGTTRGVLKSSAATLI
jgi:hypothetical protein